MVIGRYSGGGTSILRADTKGKIYFGNTGGFGIDNSYGEFVLSNGVAQADKYSFYLGSASGSGIKNVDISGTMRMYGGTFAIGNLSSSWYVRYSEDAAYLAFKKGMTLVIQ